MSGAARLFCLGLSYKTAPVALRERVTFAAKRLPRALSGLRTAVRAASSAGGAASVGSAAPEKEKSGEECAIISTCNRVELYAVFPPETAGLSEVAPTTLRRFLSKYHGVSEEELTPATYVFSETEAVRHLFEVAASLDSQILGETEILGQVKDAYRTAGAAGMLGPVLRAVFERAFFLAKEVRCGGRLGTEERGAANRGAPTAAEAAEAAGEAGEAETFQPFFGETFGLPGVPASVGSVAVALTKKIFADLGGRRALLFGSGEMAAMIVRALRAAGLSELFVAGRDNERTAAFAAREGGRPCAVAEVPERMIEADIVLTATAAPHPIIRVEHLRGVLADRRRRNRPLFIMDIAVPRNVEPEVMKLDNVFLYNIDDLETVAEAGRRRRAVAADRLRPKLAAEAAVLARELSDPGPDAAARALLARAAELRREETKPRRGTLAAGDPAGDKAAAEVEEALRRFQARLLHEPLRALRAAAGEGDGAAAVYWLSRLFKLEVRVGEDSAPDDAEAGARTGAEETGGSQPRKN